MRPLLSSPQSFLGILALLLTGCASPLPPGGKAPPDPMPRVAGAVAGAAAGAAVDGVAGATLGAIGGAVVGGMVADRQAAALAEAADAGARAERLRLADAWWEASGGAGRPRAKEKGVPDEPVLVGPERVDGARYADRRRRPGDPAGTIEPVRGTRKDFP